MSWRCAHGFHAYKFVAHKPGPDPLALSPCWIFRDKCQRCGLDRTRLLHRLPRIKMPKEKP